MFKNTKITLAAVFSILLFTPFVKYPALQAQTSQTLYFMDRIPQSSLLNPAYQPDHDFYIGIPLFSSLNVNAKSNFASFNDMVFKHHQYDSLISFLHPDADPGNFISGLKELNTIAPDLYVGILSLGYRSNNSYFTFGIADRASVTVDMPRDMIMLGLEGNESFIGRSADFSSFGGEMNYFREYTFGYSYDINRLFNVGGRAKLLFGKANMSFRGENMNLYTDPDSYNIRLISKFNMDLSMPLTLVRDESGRIDQIDSHFASDDYGTGSFLFGSRNAGMAFDAGASFRIAREVTIFASLIDLGFIGWKRDVYNLSMDADFMYEGVDISPLFDSRDDSDPVNNMVDTLKSLLYTQENSYRSGLPTRLYFGATYAHHSGINLGLLSRTEYRKNREQVVTASLMKDISPWLAASVSYSYMNRQYNSLGMGLTVRTGSFNFYMLTDNLASALTPYRKRNLNMWIGFNLAFGQGNTP